MFKKHLFEKQIDFILTLVFHIVVFTLLFILIGVFTKEIHVYCSERAINKAYASRELSIMPPANSSSNHRISSCNQVATTDDERSFEAVPLKVVPLTVVPCHVIATEDPVVSTTVWENKSTNSLFPVPLDMDVQEHIIQVCEDYQIDPALVISVIQRESSFDSSALGDNGTSEGLMQIKRQYNCERMARLGCDNLLDPKQNVTVGIDLLAELLNTYDTVEMALMVYNAGATGANTYWFSQGIYSTQYSRDILAAMAELST